ncbi:MAG: acyltransferase family protein [Bacteroidaceae bacterium]|nr:acyltransferase family protein [Bacteroidaceae bacterium]MBR5891676.1 acyltransferase family protein [Bacteroidaceae bacterium]
MEKRENIGWIDCMRVLACFLVVFSHSCDAFVAQFNNDYATFLQGCALGSLVRPCVPLFVMMSGVLLLPVRGTMTEFYSKRMKRLVVPLVFWSLVLPLAYFFYLNYGVTSNSPFIDMSLFTWEMTLRKLYTFVFNFNYDTTPLWYLYMLIGLYFIMPILSAWLKDATRKELKMVLCLWGASLFIPYIKIAAPFLGYLGVFGNMNILGECDWNAYGTFYYVSGFVGYLLLAYYLVKYPLQWGWKKLLAICVPMFLVGYAVTFGGYVVMQEYFPGNYAYLEIMWLFSGVNVFMMTFPVFVVVQKIDAPSSAWLSRVASMTFGIYLCHFVIVQMGYDLYEAVLPQGVPAVVKIVCNAVTVFAVSYLLVRLLSLNAYTRRLVA